MPMFRKSMLVLLFLALVAGGGAFYGMQSAEDATVLDAGGAPAASSGAPAAEGMTVYVTGAVNEPGVVAVASGARVADAVNACGGLSPEADAEKLNMAQPVKDGQQIRVPVKGEKGAAKNAAASVNKADSSSKGKSSARLTNEAADGLVNINTADEKELDTLPGVGPSTAQKIIEYRETEGQFATPEDIMKVKGIGKAKYEKMKDRITT